MKEKEEGGCMKKNVNNSIWRGKEIREMKNLIFLLNNISKVVDVV